MPERKRPSSGGLIGFSAQQEKTSAWKALTKNSEYGNSTRLEDARNIELAQIVPNPKQPRQNFDQANLEELAKDIRERGILQPLIVRPLLGEEGKYQIVVGERRYKAAELAGLKMLPVRIMELDDKQARLVSLVENLQRVDLDLEDEARFLKILSDEENLSTRALGELIHKSHMYVQSRLKLLEDPDLLKAIQANLIGIQEAIMISRIDDKAERQKILQETQQKEGTREQLEDLIRAGKGQETTISSTRRKTTLRAFEKTISAARNLDPEMIPPEEIETFQQTIAETISALAELGDRLGKE